MQLRQAEAIVAPAADRPDSRSGQTTVEALLVAVVLVGMVAITAVLLYTFREYGGRILDLVASDYP